MSDDKKSVSIFDLYKREKIISHTDDTGRKVDILFVKMTHRERVDAAEIYNQTLTETKEKRKNEDKNGLISALTGYSKKKNLEAVLAFETSQRESILDLMPVEDEADLTLDEKKQAQEKELATWKNERKIELEGLSEEELRNKLLDITEESTITLEAGRKFDFACLFFMCREPEDSSKRIFSSMNDIEKIQDMRVVNWLLEELREFRQFDSTRKIREVTNSSPFSQSGESQNDATDSPPSTN